jgi:NAD(P) transhydrogenase subunit alpha
MRIFVPKETHPGETRVALVPAVVQKLARIGASLEVETGLGASIGIADSDYYTAGAAIGSNREASLGRADIVLRLHKPHAAEVASMKQSCIHISYLDPFNEIALVRALATAGISAMSMEMIPRSTIAQKMDALSSQANLAGYVAVMLAANRMDRLLPMMITPSGTIPPARVLVIGVGVAGLQAIATAKRLGASVEAFDTRPVVEEQVKSLGAKFVKVDLGETGQTAQGYANELTAEQLAKQREVLAERCAAADVVITSAQVFGRKAPCLVTTGMISRMKPGSVVVDLAVESGGNVEGSCAAGETIVHGVKILGYPNLPGRVPRAASEMYSNNLANLVTHFWNKEAGCMRLDLENDIIKSCLITHGGDIINETIKKLSTAP